MLDGLGRLPDVEVVTAEKNRSATTLDVEKKSLITRVRNGVDHFRYYADTLQREASASACDVIVCPTPLAPLRGSLPAIVTVFDLSPVVLPDTHDWMSRWYLRAMSRLGISRGRLVCTISRAVATELVAHYGRLTEDQVVVAYPGPNPDLLNADPRPDGGIDGPFALMVGTIEPRKNHLTILRALAGHVRQRPTSPLRLVLAGSLGWRYRSTLQALAELGLGSRVIRLGAVDASTLKWLYHNARALLFPSLYEGFGIPVLEAFCFGCPVIAARIPPVVELAGTDAAVLLDPTDVSAWAAAIDDVAAGRLDGSLPAAGLARSRAFTWDACAASVLGAARRAVAAGG